QPLPEPSSHTGPTLRQTRDCSTAPEPSGSPLMLQVQRWRAVFLRPRRLAIKVFLEAGLQAKCGSVSCARPASGDNINGPSEMGNCSARDGMQDMRPKFALECADRF